MPRLPEGQSISHLASEDEVFNLILAARGLRPLSSVMLCPEPLIYRPRLNVFLAAHDARLAYRSEMVLLMCKLPSSPYRRGKR